MQTTVTIWLGIVLGISMMGIQGCSSGVERERGYPVPLVQPLVEARRAQGGDVLLDFQLVGEGGDTSASMGFVRAVRKVYTIMRHPEYGVLDTVRYTLSSGSGERDGMATLELNGRERWTNMKAIVYDSLLSETVIELTDRTKYSTLQTFLLPVEDKKDAALLPITLKGLVENVTDSSAVFVALATRNRIVDEEYFPSSEQLRVVLSGAHGIVWSSQMQQVFMDAVYPVEPAFVAEVKRYELVWNGRDNQGRVVPPGEYSAQLVLPVLPHAYSTVIPFHWKGGK